jgi:hypothetical protein
VACAYSPSLTVVGFFSTLRKSSPILLSTRTRTGKRTLIKAALPGGTSKKWRSVVNSHLTALAVVVSVLLTTPSTEAEPARGWYFFCPGNLTIIANLSRNEVRVDSETGQEDTYVNGRRTDGFLGATEDYVVINETIIRYGRRAISGPSSGRILTQTTIHRLTATEDIIFVNRAIGPAQCKRIY